MSTVITTAAVDDSYEITDYSNMGDSTVTIAAPGAVDTKAGCLIGTSVVRPWWLLRWLWKKASMPTETILLSGMILYKEWIHLTV